MNNVITIEFYNKKNFPPGKWLREPDLCSWEQYNLPCLSIRDMTIGIWKGFVGVSENHPFYNCSIDELILRNELLEFFFSIHGGVSSAGRLPTKYKDYAKNLWWIGMETSHGNDLMPLIKLDLPDTDMSKILGNQTYKDFLFIRKETNKLAKYLSKVK